MPPPESRAGELLSVNKRKIQANAQKYLQKGQLDKALKEYATLVELDPRDANSRLKLGDLYLRQGQKAEAVEAYLRVAQQFMKDGFDAKAVAIYKQVGKIDEERLDIHEPLAELYQRLGLTSEALGALQTAADAYHRDGRKRDALELLRKMATLDPTNTTSRLKIADLLRQADMQNDALAEYEAVAEEFERQGAREQLLSVYERILEIEPQRPSALGALARQLVDAEQFERAEPFARRLAEADPDLPDGHELLARVQTALRREDAATQTYRVLAEVYRKRGDEDRAREIAQRLIPPQGLSVPLGKLGGNLRAGAGGNLGGLAAQDATPAGRDAAAETLDLGSSSEDMGFTADAEQLMAEASVYIRYGKVDRAIATLETLLATDPDHREALEALGEAHVGRGDHGKAVEIWTRALQVAQAEEDARAFETLRQRIAALDPAVAEALLGGAPAAGRDGATAAAASRPAVEVDLEIELGDERLEDESLLGDDTTASDDGALDLDVEIADLDGQTPSAGAADATVFQPDPTPPLTEPSLGGAPDETVFQVDGDLPGDAGFEVDVDFEVDADEGLAEPPGAAAETAFQLDGDATAGASAASEAAPLLEEEDEDTASEAPASADSVSSSAPLQIADDLEEADFYLEKGLHDDAEALYRRILEVAPHHPQALLRLGEIAELRGEDPGSSAGSRTPAELPSAAAADGLGDDLADWEDPEAGPEAEAGGAPLPELDAGLADELDVDIGLELDEAAGEARPFREEDRTSPSLAPNLTPPGADAAATAAEAAAEPEPEAESEPEAEPEPVLAPEAERTAPQEAAAHAELPEIEEPQELAAHEEQPAEPREQEEPADQQEQAEQEAPEEQERAVAETPAEAEATFDLAAELSDVFESEEKPDGAVTDDSFAAIFREFKKGVKEQLSESDYEAHYDLGIAYREMGLLDDAVGEFQIGLGSPERRFSCLHMLGLCALDLQRPADAVAHFEQALALPAVPLAQQAALRFDLGRACEAAGDRARARVAFQAVASVDPGYQDVAERLAALDEGPGEGEAGPVESFESFDDLIAEAEAALGGGAEEEAAASAPDEAETPLEAEVLVEVEPEPEKRVEPVRAPEEEPPPAPRRRRKKISFF